MKMYASEGIFVRIRLTAAITLLTAGLTACGGEGGSTGPKDDGNGSSSTELSSVPDATMMSEEDAVLLAPGSLYPLTLGLTQGVVSMVGDGMAMELITEDVSCDVEGEVKVLATGQMAADSPYSAALFDYSHTDDRNCHNSSAVMSSRTNGERVIAYPSSVPDGTFIGFEKSGASLSAPFSVVLSMEGEEFMSWDRYWLGHVRLSDSGGANGSGYGETELYQVSRIGTGADGMDFLLQTGTSDNGKLNFRFDTAPGETPDMARTERFDGHYGRQWLGMGTVAASCPGGLVHVQTDWINVVAADEADPDYDYLLTGDRIVSGTVTLTDQAENVASLTYSELGVSVELNGGAATFFSYQDVFDLMIARCFGADV